MRGSISKILNIEMICKGSTTKSNFHSLFHDFGVNWNFVEAKLGYNSL